MIAAYAPDPVCGRNHRLHAEPDRKAMNARRKQAAEPEDHLGMTDEQWAWFQAYTHGFGEQDENGVDVSLLRENLRLTPTQRLEKMLRNLAASQGDVMARPRRTLRSVVTALRRRQVRYVVIGGWAMRAHGSDYQTADLDLCYARTPDNLVALAAALAPLHPRLRGAPEELPFVLDARALRSGANFTLVTEAGAVDLLGDVAGAGPFEALWERATEMELFGVPVRVASLDDLIAMKRAAGRVKDQPHLVELERLRSLVKSDKNHKNTENTK
jgi:predicted nucleotidyltransferase